jgi:hypothetical protein
MIVTVNLPYSRCRYICTVCGHAQFTFSGMDGCRELPEPQEDCSDLLTHQVLFFVRGNLGLQPRPVQVREMFFTLPNFKLKDEPLPRHTYMVRISFTDTRTSYILTYKEYVLRKKGSDQDLLKAGIYD